jgi:hypothetical protein
VKAGAGLSGESLRRAKDFQLQKVTATEERGGEERRGEGRGDIPNR